MSAQGSSAKTRENGQKPNDPEESAEKAETPETAAEETKATKVTRVTKSAEVSEESKPDTRDTVRVRPSLTSEAPPPPPSAPVDDPSPQSGSAGQARLPRKAHLVLRRVEPWSAMKFSFVLSLVCFVVLFVAVAVLYGVLSALGVFDSVVQMYNQLNNSDGQNTLGLDIAQWFGPVRILGYTALIGAVNVVLITALSTLGAVIYNVASDLVGGVEVTFSEAE